MRRQPTWDKYEVALLINAYIKVENEKKNKLEVLQELSDSLRKKAKHEGLEIDETFRNLNGMLWQFGFIDCAFKKTGHGSHMPSKLFQKMVDMYISDRSNYEKVLAEAKNKVEHDVIDEKEEREESQRKIFIQWLEKKTDLKYSKDTIIFAIDECSKYVVRYKISKSSLWNIKNEKVFEYISSKLMNNRIFKVIHKDMAQTFNKSRVYYKVFLNERRPAEITKKVEDSAVITDCAGMKNGNANRDNQLIQIIAKYFVYGFRLGSPIELMKLKGYAKEENLIINESDEEIESIIRKKGFVTNGKAFVVTDEIKNKLDNVLEGAFAQGNSIIYYESFMEKYREWLEESHIVSEELLKEFLLRTRENLFYARNFVSNKEKTTEEVAVSSEICRVWEEEVTLSVEEISARLPYIPVEKIRFYLSISRLFAWVSEGVYTRVETLVITEEEEKGILTYINRECDTNGFASLWNAPLGDVIEQNYELSEAAILIAIYNKYLSDDFYLNGKIVTREKSDIDAVLLMKQFCSEKDECTLDQAVDKVGELIGTKDRRVAYPALYDIMVRVDEQRFVSDKLVHFDIEAVDNAIKPFVRDGFVAIKEVTTFALFPICGQTWSHYLLESYCYRFSRKYSFRTNLFNGRNAGAIVDTSIDWDYKELLSRAVARANIELEEEVIGRYLFETGYMARSKFNWLDYIVERAKQIREVNK